MCTKPINIRLQEIKRRTLKHNFEKYELVRQLGYFNMLDPRAIDLTGLTKNEYFYILKNYKQILERYPNTRDKIRKQLKFYNYVNTIKAKVNSKKKNYIKKKTKLDITEPDLNCHTILH